MKIKGNKNDNNLVGTDEDDKILGLGGDDTITAKGGHDTVDGGAGDDKITIAANTSASVDAGKGNDSVKFSAGALGSTIDLGKGNDSVDVKESSQSNQTFGIDGGKGDDSVGFALDQDAYTITENGDGAHTVVDANGNSYALSSISSLTFNGIVFTPANPTNDAPVVSNPIADQVVNEDAALSFQFAANTFTDADNDALTYTATLATGAALPSWLSFDGATRTFTGTPPDNGVFAVRVTASDGSLSASDDFNITVNDVVTPPPPVPTFLERWTAADAAYTAIQNFGGPGQGNVALFGDYADLTPYNGTTRGAAALAANNTFLDLAEDYIAYLEAGGEALTGIIVKNAADRTQTLHDNILGNVSEGSLHGRELDTPENMTRFDEWTDRPWVSGYHNDAATTLVGLAFDYDNDVNRVDYDSFSVTEADQSLSANETDVGGDMFSGSGVPVDDFATAVFNAGGISVSLKADQYGNVYTDHVVGNTYTVHDGVSATNAGRSDWSMYFSVEEGLNGSDQTVGNSTAKGDFDVGLWIDIDPSSVDNFVFLANIEEIPDSVTGNADVFQNSWNFGFGFIKSQLLNNYGLSFEGPAEFEIELRLTEVESGDAIGSNASGDVVLTNHINVNVIDNEIIV